MSPLLASAPRISRRRILFARNILNARRRTGCLDCPTFASRCSLVDSEGGSNHFRNVTGPARRPVDVLRPAA
jgi:hypothetical protein